MGSTVSVSPGATPPKRQLAGAPITDRQSSVSETGAMQSVITPGIGSSIPGRFSDQTGREPSKAQRWLNTKWLEITCFFNSLIGYRRAQTPEPAEIRNAQEAAQALISTLTRDKASTKEVLKCVRQLCEHNEHPTLDLSKLSNEQLYRLHKNLTNNPLVKYEVPEGYRKIAKYREMMIELHDESGSRLKEGGFATDPIRDTGQPMTSQEKEEAFAAYDWARTGFGMELRDAALAGLSDQEDKNKVKTAEIFDFFKKNFEACTKTNFLLNAGTNRDNFAACLSLVVLDRIIRNKAITQKDIDDLNFTMNAGYKDLYKGYKATELPKELIGQLTDVNLDVLSRELHKRFFSAKGQFDPVTIVDQSMGMSKLFEPGSDSNSNSNDGQKAKVLRKVFEQAVVPRLNYGHIRKPLEAVNEASLK